MLLGRADLGGGAAERGGGAVGGAGYVQLWRDGDDGRVSRAHCRLDAGKLAVHVTDLGSAKGTRIGSADGEKLHAAVLLPGQPLHIGAYTVTYSLAPRERALDGVSHTPERALRAMASNRLSRLVGSSKRSSSGTSYSSISHQPISHHASSVNFK